MVFVQKIPNILSVNMAASPHFYLLRLRHSSLPEFFYRIRQGLAFYHLKLSKKLGGHLLESPEIEKGEIDKLLMPDLILKKNSRSYHLFNSMDSKDQLNLWQLHPKSAETDIRIRWEPARLQQAMTFINYAHHFPEAPDCLGAKQAAKTLILDWIKANPFLQGEHYLSAMECALRIPVFFYALKRLDNITSDEYDRILEAIYRHALLIAKRLSLYSSIGNHTITEAVGLVFAGAIFKRTKEGIRWLKTGIRLLTDELSHQILDDGGPAEQSLNYHRFVLDLYWLAMDFIQKNNLGAVHHWKKRLSAGEFFLNVFKDEHGAFPSIGDSDNGFAIAAGVEPARSAGKPLKESRITFEHSGYSVIRGGNLVFTFDHGPLGMSPLYNHGHADALSITLSKNGHPLLVDSGTYRYNGVPEWRRYFKGTRAHNTVTIDDQDQALQETSFIWSKPYTAGRTAHNEENNQLFCTAVHNGYTRLKDPVRHQRSVLFFDRANFLIRDRFFGVGVHCFQLNFHFHPDAVLSIDSNWWVVDNGGARVFLRLLDGGFQLVRGQKSPLMGWFSSRYGEKEPTSILTRSKTGSTNDVTFTTAIFTQSPIDELVKNPNGYDNLEHKAGDLEGTIEDS